MIQRCFTRTTQRTLFPAAIRIMAPQRRSARIGAKVESAAVLQKLVQRSAVAKTKKPTAAPATKTTKGRKTKAQKAVPEDNIPNGNAAVATETRSPPSTPKWKRSAKPTSDVSGSTFPQLTPRRPLSSAAAAADLNRPVDPHHSAATLATPHGSRITAYPSNPENASPSKAGLPRPTTTTGNILQVGLEHLLKVDPRLKQVIEKHPNPPWGPAQLAEVVDPFYALTSSIIGQQVSGAAAKSIKNKFIALFSSKTTKNGKEEFSYTDADNSYFPTPEEVAKCDITTLRTAGLSQRKAEYIQGLAEKFAAGELSAELLLNASDEVVMEKLIAVRGLGQWSVEMFSCFGLKRFDVFSTGDLGVQRGMAAFMGRDVSKLKAKGGGKFKYMSEKEMLEIAAPFSPYRSLFMWYMWRWEDVDVSVMQN